MEGFRVYRGRAAIVLAVAAVFGISGCGGSSKSTTTSNGTTTIGPSLTEEQQRQFLAESAVEFVREVSSPEALSVAGDFGGADDTNFIDPRGSIEAFTLGPQVRPQQTDDFEYCNAGGSLVEEINETDHVKLVWDNCRTEFSGPGVSLNSTVDGVVESKWSQPSPKNYSYLIETTTDAFSVDSDFTVDGETTAFRYAADGFANVEWTSDLDFLVDADSTAEFQVTCNGNSFGGEFGYRDVSVKVEPTGQPNEGELEFSGTFSVSGFSPDVDGEYTYTTLEPVFFERFNEDRPYQGKVRVEGNGFDLTVEYVDGGLFIDKQFYSWDQFEEDLDDGDIDFDEEACAFF